MKQNKVTEEAKSQADTKPRSNTALWLITSSILLLASIVSFIYFYLKGSKSRSQQENFSGAQPFEPKQAESKTSQVARIERDIIKAEPVVDTSVENIEQPERKGNRIVKWIESVNTWSLPDLTLGQVGKVASSAAGPILALAFAYFAQAVFDSTTGEGGLRNWIWLNSMTTASRLWLGAGVYLISMLIWIYFAPSVHSIGAVINQPDPSKPQQSRYHRIRFFLLITSISVYFVSILLFVTGGENGFIRGLWAAGLVCFILSQIPWLGIHTTSHPEAEESPRFQWQNWLVLGIILGVAFWLRFYKLATIPNDLHGDMASYGLVARDYLLGIEKNIFGYGFYDIPIMGFLPTIFSMAVFGNNIFGLQMTAVLGGLFSLLAVYLLIWRLFNSHRLAALTVILLSINIAHIHFSRIAAYMDPWPFGYFALFFLMDGLKARRAASFGLAGVLLGLGLQMYFSGRVLVFIIGFFLLYAFFFQRAWITQNKRGLVLMVIGFLLAIGPGLVFHATHWSSFNSRAEQVFLFNPEVMTHLTYKYAANSPFVVLLTQIKLTLLMFNHSIDTSTQFGYLHPMFSSLLSPLIVLGLGFALRRWKDASLFLILIWLGLMAVLGSILTLDAPFWPRLVGILPAAALLAAVALDQILELGKKIFGAHAGVFIAALMVVFLATAGYLNWNQYYSAVKEKASPQVVIGRYINKLPVNVTACSLLNSPPLIVRETKFLAWPHKLVDIQPDAPDSDLDTCSGSSLVWVISPENIGRLDAIRARWPDGIVQNYNFPNFDYTLTFYLVGVLPPAIQFGAPSNQLAWYFYEISIILALVLYGIIALFLYGMLIWFLFRSRFLKISHGRQKKNKVDFSAIQINQNVPRQPDLSGLLWDMFTAGHVGFIKWYNEIIAFKPPTISPKLIVSTLLSLAAVGLAYFAQTFLDQQKNVGLHLSIEWLYLSSESQRLGVACLIFLIAALLWTFTTTDRDNDLSQGQNLKQGLPEGPSLQKSNNISQLIVGSPIQVVSIFSAVSAMFLYAVLGENSLVRWLWIAGVGLFLASLFMKNQFDAAALREESPPFHWYHALVLCALLILAFCLRIYRLYDIPLDLSTDMASLGISAREYILGTEQRIFGTGYFPRILFLPYVMSMRIVGNNLFGLYFATVIMGTLNVLGIYLFTWRLFDRHRLAILTAAIITIHPAHINYSRLPSMVDPWFLGFFGLFFFFDGLKGRRTVSLAIAGLFTGFVLVSYPSGRAILPMIAFALASAWLFKRKWLTDNYGGLAWMALGVLVALGPNLVFMIIDWPIYIQRAGEIIIFSPGNLGHLKYSYATDSVWMVVWEQVKRSVLLFNYYVDKSAQFSYPYPMFNSLVSPMLILGFGMGLYRWRKPSFLFVTSSFIFILVTGGILTVNAPTWSRLVGIIPLAALLIALVIDEFMIMLERVSMKAFIPFMFTGVVLFLATLAVMDWKDYIQEVEHYARPVVRVGRYLDSLPDEITACGITDGFPINQEEIMFLAWPRSIVVVPPDTAALTADICPGQNLVWILSPTYQNRLSELQTQWPGGIIENHRLENGDLMFTSYLVFKQTNP